MFTRSALRPVTFFGFALLALVALGMAAPSPLRRTGPGNLEARWKMDEGSGTTTADATGSGNTATLVGGVSWTTGQFGGGLSFNGTTGYLSVADATGLNMGTGSFTVASWVNPTTTANPHRLMNKWDGTKGWLFDVNTGGGGGSSPGAVRMKLSDGTTTIDYSTNGPVVAGSWQHVAAVVDRTGNTLTLYCNGVGIGTPQSLTTITGSVSTTAALGMGSIPGGPNNFLSGSLDEARLYSRALPSSEVGGLAGMGPLEGLWHLDEGTGTSAADSSGNGQTGTLTNGPTWVAGQVGQAVQFDGTNDYINLGSNLNTLRKAPAATLAGWIKINTLPASGVSMELVGFSINAGSATSSSRARIKVVGTGTAANLVAGGRSTDTEGLQDLQDTSTALAAGTWYHVAGVIDYTGKTVKLYVNGSPVASATKSFAANTTPDTASTSSALGAEEDGSAGFFNGILDEVRVYSRALSTDEIAGLAGGTGTGLSAVYYDNMDFTGTFVQQTDATVNFQWGTGVPTTGIGADTFSVLWTGQVQPQFTETYTFFTNTDDGVKLWVNDQLIIDFPQNQSLTERSGSIALSGGAKVNLRMEYFENTGTAQAELRWASASTPKAIVPQAQLYPTDTITPALLNATSATGDLTHVSLRFNEAMNAATATTTGNYTLSGGLTVSTATISADKKVVTITASGNVTLGTTTVTASASIKNLEQEAIVQTTKTIVAGNNQGFDDASAIGLLMTTDGNHSAVMMDEPTPHANPPGLGESLRVVAPGTTATTVLLRQVKKQGGTGRLNFQDSGTNFTTTVTTSGGADNKAYVTLRHNSTSASEGDITIEAVVSGQVQGTHDACAVTLAHTPKYSYLSDQTPVTQSAQITPVIQGMQFTNKTGAMDYGGTEITTNSTLLKLPAWPNTDATGLTSRTATPRGVDSFVYDSTQLARPMEASFGTPPPPNVGTKWPEGGPNYEYGKEDTVPGTSDYSSTCPNCNPKYSSGAKPPQTGTKTGGGSCCGRNSVDLSDGEKKLQYSELVIRGRGFDYEFRRVYRSYDYRKGLAAAGAPVVRDYGVAWTYSYADEYLLKDGSGAENVSNIINCRAGQSATIYVNLGTDRWVARKDHYDQLRRNPTTGDFEIRDRDGMIRVYTNFQTGTTPNKNGRLKELRDRNDNAMRFFYEQIDPDNTVSGDEKYVLAYVIDTLGREIRYQYYAKTAQTVSGRTLTLVSTNVGALGRLARVIDFKDNMTFSASPTQAQDFPGQIRNRTLVFDYDTEGNLVRSSGPAIAATPNGNDFPNGKTMRYRYYTSTQHSGFSQAQWDALTQAQRDRLLHKMTHIWYPNEVRSTPGADPADADAAEVLGYETNTAARYFGFVTSYTVGGTNGNGVPAGETINYAYTDMNPSHGVAGAPYNYFLVASLKVAATDRKGNQAEYVYTAEKTLQSSKELPRGLRAGEPASFDRQYVSNGNALLRGDRLLTKRTEPLTNTLELQYNDATTDRFQQGNMIRIIGRPDAARGGDQAKLETVIVYEPVFNQPWLMLQARGSDMAGNGFTPPISDPATRTITDPYDATKTLNLRYAVVSYYDYQESALASTGWVATNTWTPTTVDSVTVKATEVLLVRKLGLPDGNDTDRANSIRTLRSRLSANLVKLGLGDLNGDGNTDPKANGNVIRTAYGSPVLLANTNQHKLEGDIETAGDLIDQTKDVVDGGTQEGTNGARLQTIVWMYQYNNFGQIVQTISPEANVTTHEYFAENDPDGDGIVTPAPADGRTLGTLKSSQDRSLGGGGYVNDTRVDRTRTDAYVKFFDQSGVNKATATFHNNKTAPQATTIFTCSCLYDDVGNLIERDNPRRITDRLFVNEVNEVLQVTKAVDISQVGQADPSDPLLGATIGPLTAFAYKTRTFFDYNGYVVLAQVEDRGNTSSVDGSGLGALPAQATDTTPGLSSADSAGGDAYVDGLSLYDRLNDLIETRVEVDSTRSLNTRFRYDGNQNQVLTIWPEGNATSAVFDERELLFQRTRGASSRPSAGKYAAGDPTSFNRPGGSGTTASTFTLNYDKNRNLIETVDADDHGGEKSSIAPTGSGAGDVTRHTYDGFNRRKTTTDPLGNKTTFIYDPDSNMVRVIMDGDPVDDLAGATENKTMSVTERIYDERSRPVCSHQVLFQTPDASPSRTPILTDTPAMDSFAAYLADASSDTATVPGATGITVIGRVTSLTEFDRESRAAFQIKDDLYVHRSEFDGAGRVVKFTDDALSNGFSSGAFDPASISGNTIEVDYDDNGNVIEIKETEVTSISGMASEIFRTTWIYDALDRLQTTFDSLGQAVDFRYDSRSNGVATADAIGSVSSRSFARRGLGSTSAVTVNNYGNVMRRRYDGQSRLLETEVRLTSSAQGDGTNIGATLEGVLTTAPTVDTSQSGDGLISVYFAYDDNSRLLALRDDDGNTTAYIYDNLNRALIERKGLALTGTTFSISGGDSGSFAVALRGGVTPVDTESPGTDVTRGFDKDSNITSVTDEAGNVGAVTYDALDRMKSRSMTRASGFIGTTSQTMKWDGLTRMTGYTDDNDTGTSDDVTSRWFFDSLSRMVEESQQIGSLSTRAVTYGFELDGPSGAPSVNRPSETIYPDGRKIRNRYDRLDRLIDRRDVVGTTEYDPIGTYQYIGRQREAVLTYQNNIRLTHIGQVSGQNADVGFDGLGRVVNHRWESFTTQALGAGTLVMGFEHQDGNTTPAPQYDRANNRKIEYKTHDPTNSEQFKYDSSYRLTSPGSGSQGVDSRAFERGTFTNANRASMSGGVAFYQDWDLEGLGNWTRLDDNARVETRTHSDINEIVDRVVSGNTATLTHDKNGNVTDTGYSSLGGQTFPGGGLRMEWDTFGRLRKIYKNNNTPGSTGDDVLVGEYTYDGHNRRMRKVVTNSGSLNGTTSFYYDGWRVVEERDSSDAITNQYTYGNYLDEVWTLDNRRSGAGVDWLNDHSGTYRHFYLSNMCYHVYGLTNEGSSSTPGSLKEAYQYDAYGRQTVITDGNDADNVVNFNSNDVRTPGGTSTINGNPYTYTGQRLDDESGLHFFKNRVYSSDLGRFHNRNPWGYVQGRWSLYDYCWMKPTMCGEPLSYGTYYGKPGGPVQPAGYPYPIERNKTFQEWYDAEMSELKRTGWDKLLDDCPCKLKCWSYTSDRWDCGTGPYTVTTYYAEVEDKDKWISPSEPGQEFHPGAKWEIRSRSSTKDDAGQQCTYDANCNLITGGAGAGTADRQTGRWYNWYDHYVADVARFNEAVRLDGGDPAKPGENVRKYWDVRPQNPGKGKDGKPCPENIVPPGTK